MHKIYKVKDMLCDELEQFGARDKIDAQSLEMIDKLAHAIKNIDKIIESSEEREYSNYGGSMRGGNSYRYDDNMSYARGRNSRGRYSRDGYSNGGDMRMELQELMNEAPNEQFRQRIQRMMADM